MRGSYAPSLPSGRPCLIVHDRSAGLKSALRALGDEILGMERQLRTLRHRPKADIGRMLAECHAALWRTLSREGLGDKISSIRLPA